MPPTDRVKTLPRADPPYISEWDRETVEALGSLPFSREGVGSLSPWGSVRLAGDGAYICSPLSLCTSAHASVSESRTLAVGEARLVLLRDAEVLAVRGGLGALYLLRGIRGAALLLRNDLEAVEVLRRGYIARVYPCTSSVEAASIRVSLSRGSVALVALGGLIEAFLANRRVVVTRFSGEGAVVVTGRYASNIHRVVWDLRTPLVRGRVPELQLLRFDDPWCSLASLALREQGPVLKIEMVLVNPYEESRTCILRSPLYIHSARYVAHEEEREVPHGATVVRIPMPPHGNARLVLLLSTAPRELVELHRRVHERIKKLIDEVIGEGRSEP